MSTQTQREKWAHKKTRSWKVFREVMEFYFECKANMAACQPVDYDGNVGSHGYVIGKVIMLPSDFTSDVAMVAKRMLTEKQYSFFKSKYLSKDEATQTTISTEDVKIQEILGNEFFRIGISPVHKYMKTVRKF